VALITGAASGMGRATAHLFADEGAHVAVIDRDADGARRVAQEIASAGGSAHAWDLDVGDETRIAATVASVVARYGGLGILINNAGVSGRVFVEAEGYGGSGSDLRHQSDGAGQSDPRLPAAPAPERGGAHRQYRLHGGPRRHRRDQPVHGQQARSDRPDPVLAVELGGVGVTVNCICPGPIHTASRPVFRTRPRQVRATACPARALR
jgi:3-oxoacyl-[acyl-carrier protein] reductase